MCWCEGSRGGVCTLRVTVGASEWETGEIDGRTQTPVCLPTWNETSGTVYVGPPRDRDTNQASVSGVSLCVCVACAAVHVRLSAHMFLKCISVGVRAVQLTCLHLQYNHTPSAILQSLDLNPRKHVRTIKLQICSLIREKCVKPFSVSFKHLFLKS